MDGRPGDWPTGGHEGHCGLMVASSGSNSYCLCIPAAPTETHHPTKQLRVRLRLQGRQGTLPKQSSPRPHSAWQRLRPRPLRRPHRGRAGGRRPVASQACTNYAAPPLGRRAGCSETCRRSWRARHSPWPKPPGHHTAQPPKARPLCLQSAFATERRPTRFPFHRLALHLHAHAICGLQGQTVGQASPSRAQWPMGPLWCFLCAAAAIHSPSNARTQPWCACEISLYITHSRPLRRREFHPLPVRINISDHSNLGFRP